MLESLVLRTGGPDLYDAWARHEVPFDDPAIQEAGDVLDRLVSGSGFVAGGTEAISTTHPAEGISSVAGSDRSCWMTHQGSSSLGDVPSATELGDELGFFVLPPVTAGEAAPLTGSVAYLAPIADRPEVRRFMRRVASEEFGKERARLGGLGAFFSPNTKFQPVNYQLGLESVAAKRLNADLGLAVRDALLDGRFRIDASDAMPVHIGFYDRERGAFLQGMIDFVDRRRTIEQVLHDVEVAWQQSEAAEGP